LTLSGRCGDEPLGTPDAAFRELMCEIYGRPGSVEVARPLGSPPINLVPPGALPIGRAPAGTRQLGIRPEGVQLDTPSGIEARVASVAPEAGLFFGADGHRLDA
jgi:hypothetical protein